jgi:biopolymer transport protein ExbD
MIFGIRSAGLCPVIRVFVNQKGVYSMKSLIEVCVIGSILILVAGAQETPRPALRKGVSVHMPVANHAVEMRAADEPNATVVAITADGKVFVGVEPTEPDALSSLRAKTVYVKADSRVPFQTVLAVLDALRGKSVVLLAASPASVKRAKFVSPYGIKVIVSR